MCAHHITHMWTSGSSFAKPGDGFACFCSSLCSWFQIWVSGGRRRALSQGLAEKDEGGLRLEYALKRATVICMHGDSARRRRRPVMSSNFLPREEMWFVGECGGGDGHSRITLEHLTLSPEELTKTKVHPPVMIRSWRAKPRTVRSSWMTDEWHSLRLSPFVCRHCDASECFTRVIKIRIFHFLLLFFKAGKQISK